MISTPVWRFEWWHGYTHARPNDQSVITVYDREGHMTVQTPASPPPQPPPGSQPPPEQAPPTPWWRHTWVLALAAGLVGAGIASVATGASTKRKSVAAPPPRPEMTAECWRALIGYIFASDPDESDFWAESWATFGCGSGYYA